MRGSLTREDAAILARMTYVMRMTFIYGDRRDAEIMRERTKDADIVMPAFWEQ